MARQRKRRTRNTSSSGSDRRTAWVQTPPGGGDGYPAETGPGQSEQPVSRGPRFPIVAVGASAGGLEAFSHLLRNLPARPGMGFVFVQHLDPTHGSMLSELLARTSSMPVGEVEDGTTVEPNRVYVIRPNTDLSIEDGVLRVFPRTEVRGQHMPVDFFLRALATDQGSFAIGIVLSGTASDGAQGLTAVKAEGGITFAQDEKSAKYGGMPHAAVSAGGVDFVLPPEGIARELARIAGDPDALKADRQTVAAQGDEELMRILAILRKATGIDLSYYKRPNLLRRIQRRCLLQQITALGDYIRYLQEHPAEIDALHHDILINVTSFFRDEATLEGLRAFVFPALLKGRPRDVPLRIWVPGCATGEEAYSLAIALLEFLEQASASTPVQIFATDVSDRAIETARAGVYLENIAADVAPERLRRFFVKVDRGFQVSKRIRDLIIFAKHNLVSDPPFSQLDLISCCNVLIYLRHEYQRRVMELFHYALKPHGFLKLGRSETIGAFPELFAVADREHKIYAKKLAAQRTPPTFTARARMLPDVGTTTTGKVWNVADLQKAADRLVMGRYAPAGVLINEDMDVVQFRGHTGPYLEPAPGDATFNLLKMAREGLALDLRTAIHQARKDKHPVRKPGITVNYAGDLRKLNLEVTPIESAVADGRYYLVLFEEISEKGQETRDGKRRGGKGRPSKERVEHRELTHLRAQLAATKGHLQTIIEELEAANEELKSANEETLSSNEELQSTNEELETAKEELQSTNEELTTVNEQLHTRNAELTSVANDLSNLLSSVSMPIVMVSSDLRIRRATPAATKVLNLLPADVGRPISDINLEIGVTDLREKLLEVIEAVAVREFDARDRTGRRYVLRLQPYRTPENKIDGAVMVMVDVDDLRQSLEDAEAARETVRRVQEITEAAVADRPLDDLLHELLVRVQTTLAVDTAACLLRLPGDEDGDLRLQAVVGLDGEFERDVRVPTGRGFAGRIAAERRPVVLEDVDYGQVVSPWIQEKGLRSLAGVPLQADGRLIGVLHVGTVLQRKFRPDEVDLLRLAGERIGLAVERAASRDAERGAREAAEALNQAKDEFFALLSHELRSPLNAMTLWLRVLRGESVTKEQTAHAVDALERSVAQQVRLIGDLLDVSRIISGKLELEVEHLDVVAAVAASVEGLRGAAESKGIELRLDSVDGPCVALADDTRLDQAVRNLGDNAIKFTPKGGRVTIRVTRDGSEVKVAVVDTGQGIAPDFLPYVFDRFRQADSTTTRRHGGLGLGLAIARHVVERQGGTIRAESAGVGRGSTFTISLPLTPVPHPRAGSGSAPVPRRVPELEQISVLVVDDDADTCNALALAFEQRGLPLWVARSVRDALVIYEAAKPRVVISDISMPGEDGYALMRQIRARDGERGTTTLGIALTGFAGVEHRQKALAAGFVEHIAKPVKPEVLLDTIRSLVRT